MNWVFKIFPWKMVLKYVFGKFVIPKLRVWAKNNELPSWDEKLVDELEKHYKRLIDLL